LAKYQQHLIQMELNLLSILNYQKLIKHQNNKIKDLKNLLIKIEKCLL